MTLVKWKGEEAYLCDEGVYAHRRWMWTQNVDHATRSQDEKEARWAFVSSGAGDVRYLELIDESSLNKKVLP